MVNPEIGKKYFSDQSHRTYLYEGDVDGVHFFKVLSLGTNDPLKVGTIVDVYDLSFVSWREIPTDGL